jgi:hypothetical protein
VICLRNLYNEHICICKYTDDVWVPSDPGPEHVRFAGLGCQQGFRPRWHITDRFEQQVYGNERFSRQVEGFIRYSDIKQSRRNNVEDYRGVAISSAIP